MNLGLFLKVSTARRTGELHSPAQDSDVSTRIPCPPHTATCWFSQVPAGTPGQVHVHWAHTVCQTLMRQPRIRSIPALKEGVSVQGSPTFGGVPTELPHSLSGSHAQLWNIDVAGRKTGTHTDAYAYPRIHASSRITHQGLFSLSKPPVAGDTK